MKILLLGSGKVKYMPYMNFYLDNINTDLHETHLIYWNNDNKDEDLSFLKKVILHEYAYYQEDEVSLFSKLKGYCGFRHFVKVILSQNDFDYIIVLHSITGVVVFDKLFSYKNKFIFDYRDSTYEAFPPFKWIISQMVKLSDITFVSSDGFRRFLPLKYKEKILTSHNLLKDSLLHISDKEKYGIPSNKIRISFWGFIRHERINKILIERISRDQRFELHYYGREQQTAINLKNYVSLQKINNVFFHGEYNPEDRYKFILETDLIDNIYFDDNSLLAMGNKYYDSVIFRIPQICIENSVMGQMAEKAKIGIVCNPYDDDCLDKIYDYYHSIDFDTFHSACKIELERIMKEYEYGVSLQRKIFG